MTVCLLFYLANQIIHWYATSGAAVQAVPQRRCTVFKRKCSHNANSGGDFESFLVGSEGTVGLLFTIGSHKGIDSLYLDFVEFLAGSLNDGFLGASINNENEGVVIFNGLDGTLGADGVLHDGIWVENNWFLDSDSEGDGCSLLGLSDWATEGDLVPDLSLLVSVCSFLH